MLRVLPKFPSPSYVVAALWLLLWPVAKLGAAETRHVLVLSSSARPFAPQSTFVDALVEELTRASRDPIAFVEMSVQDARASARGPDASVMDRLESSFGTQQLDLIITIGGPAATFAREFRPRLFPSTPMLLAGVDRRFVESGSFTEKETTVAIQHEPALIIDSILRLLPSTKVVTVIVGASPVEQFWLKEMQREFARFERRLQFTWTNELSFKEIVERSGSLPPDSAIFFALLALDAKGEPIVAEQAFSAIRAAANAPIFSLYTGDLGKGSVGGPLLVTGDLGKTTVKVALRILGGESPGRIRSPIQRAGAPTFDWRELQRWNIADGRLPPGAVVLFREPAFWERGSNRLAAGALVMVVALGLILVALRRRPPPASEPAVAQVPAASSSATTVGELSNLSRRLMELHDREGAAVAKKLHDDVCQRITALALRLHGIKAAPHDQSAQADVEEISKELARLVGELVTVPDGVYQKLEFLGLTHAARGFCDQLSAKDEIAVHFHDQNVPRLATDVALALFRVLQEAAVNAVIHSCAPEVWVTLRGCETEVRLEIVDAGIGFDAKSPTRDGVGLVAMRERIKLVKGGASIESRPSLGTRVEAWVPLRPAALAPALH